MERSEKRRMSRKYKSARFFYEHSETRSAAGACASRPRRESPAEDFLTCTYFLIEGNFCGWLC
ncbi:hypothetical protein DPMN_117295 [Dreissena polymorpha]|uniref:Uncharacterized protein n=1 Tax=Dreissena polymorpha TaxID=45954 RepID=A0A9D4QUB0_DREPO|nr:hypothetical protein DPMN_117295 [Dreissena polymorpha]